MLNTTESKGEEVGSTQNKFQTLNINLFKGLLPKPPHSTSPLLKVPALTLHTLLLYSSQHSATTGREEYYSCAEPREKDRDLYGNRGGG